MLELLVPPAVEPLDIETCKFWARLDGTDFDAALPGMIAAARSFAEQELGAKIITQVWRETFDVWPSYVNTKIHLYPVKAVAVSYWDGAFWQSVNPANLALIPNQYGIMFRPNTGYFFPTIGWVNGPAIRADFTVGMSPDAAGVPAGIKQFIAAHVAFWARNPEAATERQMVPSPYLASLLDPHRTYL